jgi:hypothetical protein
VSEIFETEYIEYINGAAGTLSEQPDVDAGDKPLKHFGVEQLCNGVPAAFDLWKLEDGK